MESLMTNLPLTIYFDASCPLCNSEIQNIKLHDAQGHLILVDCSASNFDVAPFENGGITLKDMMQALHVRNNQGDWIIGVPAFELIYQAVGLTAIANFWGGKFTGALAAKLYPWIARNRQLLSRAGLQWGFKLWSKYQARRAQKRSKQCHAGQCSI
jgi:predicted DCC family thiol-disulfide oxidoreductase YuxK